MFCFRLDEILLKDNLVNLFLKSLSCVSMPVNILLYYLKSLSKLVKDSLQFNTLLDFVMKDIYNEKPDSADVTKFCGNSFKTISDFEKDLQCLRKEKNPTKRFETIKNLDDRLRQILISKKKLSVNLKDYSPWLANFHSADYDLSLEIPGQYTGLKMPLPHYHVKIAGFQSKVI